MFAIKTTNMVTPEDMEYVIVDYVQSNAYRGKNLIPVIGFRYIGDAAIYHTLEAAKKDLEILHMFNPYIKVKIEEWDKGEDMHFHFVREVEEEEENEWGNYG